MNNEIEELKKYIGDREWRLANLYFIIDKNLNKILFKKNRAQADFDKRKTKRNNFTYYIIFDGGSTFI